MPHHSLLLATMTQSSVQLPPGLTYDGPLVQTANGGVSDWVEYKKVKAYTNAFVILDESKVGGSTY